MRRLLAEIHVQIRIHLQSRVGLVRVCLYSKKKCLDASGMEIGFSHAFSPFVLVKDGQLIRENGSRFRSLPHANVCTRHDLSCYDWPARERWAPSLLVTSRRSCAGA